MHGSSHSGSGLMSSGAGLPEARHTEQSVSGGGGARTHTQMKTHTHNTSVSEIVQKKSSVCALELYDITGIGHQKVMTISPDGDDFNKKITF